MKRITKNNLFKTLISSLVIAASIFTFVGCSKKVTDEATFKSVAEAKGFTVSSPENLKLGNSVKILQAAKENISINYWEYATEDDAKAAYDILFAPHAQNGEEAAPGAVLEGSNFKKYTVEDLEDYSIISRVDNTLILGNCTIADKDVLKAVTDELGY